MYCIRKNDFRLLRFKPFDNNMIYKICIPIIKNYCDYTF